MLTGFHGLHVIMVPYLYCTIFPVNKDHFLPQVILVLKRRMVLALRRCGLAFIIHSCLRLRELCCIV